MWRWRFGRIFPENDNFICFGLDLATKKWKQTMGILKTPPFCFIFVLLRKYCPSHSFARSQHLKTRSNNIARCCVQILRASDQALTLTTGISWAHMNVTQYSCFPIGCGFSILLLCPCRQFPGGQLYKLGEHCVTLLQTMWAPDIRTLDQKVRRNKGNMSTQHLATLLRAMCCTRLTTLWQHTERCWIVVV